MSIKNLPGKLNILLFLFSLLLYLCISWDSNSWTQLGDPPDYLRQSKISLLDREFYAPHKSPGFYPRPFTVPLFYKFCNANTDVIVQMQKCLHTLSAFLLVAALLLYVNKNSVKYFLIISIYLLMSWWNILGWTIVILSESISMSLLFCWIATFLIWYKKRQHLWLILHLLVLVLFSFSRDSWPYIIVGFNTLIFLSFLVFGDRQIKPALVLLVFSCVIFYVQQQSAKTGCRYQLPLINSIIVRVLPNNEHCEWFAQNQMPCLNSLKANFSGIDVRDKTAQERIFKLYTDSAYQELFTWIALKGQGTYVRFLFTHPAYTFFMEERRNQLERIWARDLYYADGARGYSQLASLIFPVFNTLLVFLLCVTLLAWGIIRKEAALVYPFYLFSIFTANVILCYNADALEVERHLFITDIMIQFIGLISLALIWDKLSPQKLKEILKPTGVKAAQ